jgi:hypothetical protein
MASKVVVEWITLLHRTGKVSGSILVPETGYPNLGLPWFFSVLPGKFRDSVLN